MKKVKTINSLKIPAPNLPSNKTSKSIPISKDDLDYFKTQQNKNIVFSFRFIELNHKAFNLGGTCNKWSNDLFILLNELSNITRNQFVNGLKKHYRSHTHNWKDLDYKYNFSDTFLEQVECRQARISSSKGGIHGFIVGNMFYIVWLDPHHNLYPDDRYGGLKTFEPPETCCFERDYRIEELEYEVKECKKELHDYEEILNQKTLPD